MLGDGGGSFATAVEFAVGQRPTTVAIGDLDGDQVPDMAVANMNSDNVSVLLGVGDGTFSARVDYIASDGTSSVVIGDIDGDQVPDLAVANQHSGTVHVLHGIGDGTFPVLPRYAVDNTPWSIAIGDLNGDQVPDMATANFGDNVSVLLGVGDGTFVSAVQYGAGDGPRSIAIGHLNGDQVPDLAVANDNGDTVAVLLGVGDGTFVAPVTYAAGIHPSAVSIGDLDGDQVSDLVVTNGSSDDVSILLGIGDGTFAVAVHYAVGAVPNSVAIADLDGDQMPDLAVANRFGDNVSVLLGVGDGTFDARVNYNVGSRPYSVAIGDLNGDQNPDLAVANRNSDDVSVLLGVGNGSFATAVNYATGTLSRSVAIGDLDADQVPDLAVANSGSDDVSVLLGVGDGTFAPQLRYYVAGEVPLSVSIGDLNGDTAPDLAVVNRASDDISVLINRESSIPGACCLADGSCMMTRLALCISQPGFYRGDGSFCPPDPSCAGFETMMTCELSSPTVKPGGAVSLDVFVEEVVDLAAYQATIQITKTSGSGTVTVPCPDGARVNEKICISTDTFLPTGDACDGGAPCPVADPPNVCVSRPDYVFAGLQTVALPSCETLQVAAATLSSSTTVTGERKYIGDFLLEVSPNTEVGSTFEISFVPGISMSTLLNETATPVPTSLGPPCVLTITDSLTFGKNRYLSFKPGEPGAVAYKLDMVSSLSHPTAIVSGWVGVPDAAGIASLVPDPETRMWIEPVVNITGCDIAPVAEFELRASQDGGQSFLPPLALRTIPQPGGGKFWGDTCGSFNGVEWSAPQGITNIDDAVCVIKTWQAAEGAPEVPRTDMVPQVPNRVTNFNDVLFVIFAFQGDPYPFGCPDDPCQDNIVNPCP